MSLVKEIEGRGRFRLTVVGTLGGKYIFKPPTREYPELPENEHVTMRIAEAYGIKTVPSSLIRLKSGEISYITRRIDRTPEGKKIHMIDMFQILEAYDKYKGSYEKIGKALGSFSSNTMLDKLNFLELLVFCFLTANSDMHLKNFSMIEGPSGWVLAPAYDLLNVSLAIPSDQEDVALSLSGKKSKLSRNSFKNLGIGMGLNKKQIEGVFRRFGEKKEQSIDLIKKSFLSSELKERYLQTLDERYKRAGMFIP
jgi:serine/threonine-protein kinase HipA